MPTPVSNSPRNPRPNVLGSWGTPALVLGRMSGGSPAAEPSSETADGADGGSIVARAIIRRIRSSPCRARASIIHESDGGSPPPRLDMLGSFIKLGWIKPREQNNGPGMNSQSVSQSVRQSEAWQGVRVRGKKTCKIHMARGRAKERKGRAVTSGHQQCEWTEDSGTGRWQQLTLGSRAECDWGYDWGSPLGSWRRWGMIVRMSVTTRSLSSKAPGKVAVRCRRRDLLRVPGRREPWLLSRCRRTASVDQSVCGQAQNRPWCGLRVRRSSLARATQGVIACLDSKEPRCGAWGGWLRAAGCGRTLAAGVQVTVLLGEPVGPFAL